MHDSEETRILIVDDQRLFAEGLRTILESRTGEMTVVGIAENGEQAIAAVSTLDPDIVLMDVRMPVMDGVEATKQILGVHPDVRIVMLTTFDDDEYVKYSLANGAIGYLLKNRPPAELIASIRAVKGGILQIDPGVSKSLIHDVRRDEFDGDEFLHRLIALTNRERQVLQLLVDAYDNRQIATEMGVAEQTVRNYISIIYSKLGIENRIEIMRHMDKVHFYLEHFQ